MRSCNLHTISPDAFDGLESSLQILDLSNNNLTGIPDTLTMNFTVLGELNIKNNPLSAVQSSSEILNGMQQTLYKIVIKPPSIGVNGFTDLKKFVSKPEQILLII